MCKSTLKYSNCYNKPSFFYLPLKKANIFIDGTVLEQVRNFEYLGYSVSYNTSKDVVNKLHKFNLMRGTITVSYTHLDVYKRQKHGTTLL